MFDKEAWLMFAQNALLLVALASLALALALYLHGCAHTKPESTYVPPWPAVEAVLDVALEHAVSASPELAVWRDSIDAAARAVYDTFVQGFGQDNAHELSDAAMRAGMSHAHDVPESLEPALRAALHGVVSYLWMAAAPSG